LTFIQAYAIVDNIMNQIRKTPNSLRMANDQQPSGSFTNFVKRAMNRMISGESNSPFEDARPVSRGAKRAGIAAVALAGVATVAALSPYAIGKVHSIEKANAKATATTQTYLEDQFKGFMVEEDKAVVASYNTGNKDIIRTFLPGEGMVQYTGDTTDIVMHTVAISGPGSRTADPNHPVFMSWRNNSGTGPNTTGDLFTITAPEGNSFNAKGQGYMDFFGSTHGGWGGVDTNYDTSSTTGFNGQPIDVSAPGVVADARDFPPQFHT
jgi:hypothetical protein